MEKHLEAADLKHWLDSLEPDDKISLLGHSLIASRDWCGPVDSIEIDREKSNVDLQTIEAWRKIEGRG